MKNASVYQASKFWLRGFAWALKNELKDKKIFIINPKILETNFHKNSSVFIPTDKEKITSLESIFEVVENILKNLNLSKNAELIVTKDMRLALGDKILDYKISDQTVESGCSIKDGNLIYNNEFSNLIEFNREELEREILNKIFE